MHQPRNELAISRSQVRCPNHYTTQPLIVYFNERILGNFNSNYHPQHKCFCVDTGMVIAIKEDQPWRYPPNSHVSPFFLPPPQTIFGHCIRNFVQFMRVFSEFWKLSVRDNDPPPKKKYINGVGKAHCMLSFLSVG